MRNFRIQLWIAIFVGIIPYSALGKALEEGKLTTGEYSNAAGMRTYSLYVPPKLAARPGLLVVLHGCFMTPQQMIDGTLFNQIAARKGFVVLYPEQSYNDNQWKCWNWFKPENQQRNTGESSIIAGMTQEVIKNYNLDSKLSFVTGLSAGAVMSSNLLGCYSDVFSGGAIHSGLEFAAAQNEDDAHKVVKEGPKRNLDSSVDEALACSPAKKELLSILVIHGDMDPYVNIINGERTSMFFEKLNTKLFLNQGHKQNEITHDLQKIDPTGPKQFPADLSITLYAGSPQVKKIVVKGMGHGWSGGKPVAPYMEPRGVNVSELIANEFFK